MSRIALLCSEPLRERMAGIGIRYLELARRLPQAGIDTVLISAGPAEEVPETPATVRPAFRQPRGLTYAVLDIVGLRVARSVAHPTPLETGLE